MLKIIIHLINLNWKITLFNLFFYRPKMSDMETTRKCSPSKANYTPISIGAVIAVIGVVVGIAGITTACITITKSKRLLKGNNILMHYFCNL